MKKATIYDYARMCRTNIHKCENCPMWNYKCSISAMDVNDTDKANEIILKWCEEHPIKTKQSEFLKMFPKAVTNGNGRISICPKNIDKTHECELKPNECANAEVVKTLTNELKTAKSEAIKEFAHFVIDRSKNGVICTSDICDLVKEMTEVQK